jgi:hypothetical protein
LALDVVTWSTRAIFSLSAATPLSRLRKFFVTKSSKPAFARDRKTAGRAPSHITVVPTKTLVLPCTLLGLFVSLYDVGIPSLVRLKLALDVGQLLPVRAAAAALCVLLAIRLDCARRALLLRFGRLEFGLDFAQVLQLLRFARCQVCHAMMRSLLLLAKIRFRLHGTK